MRELIILFCGAFLLALTLFIGCSNDKPTESDDGTGTPVSLEQTQSGALSFVKVNGLPANNDSLYAIVRSTAKADDSGYSLIMNTDSGYYLVSPLNPSDPTGGGTVQILISDGHGFVSDSLELLLDSLPEAPGELEAIVSLMQQVLTEQLRIGGYTRDSLDNMDSTNIPLHMIQLAEFYDIVDSPDNPNSLRAVVDGTAPLLTEAGGDMDLFNRIWALTGYREYYADLRGQLEGVDTVSFSRENVLTIQGAADLARSTSSNCIQGPDFGISDCASLAAYMLTASKLTAAANSAGDKVKADIAGAGLFMMGLIPGGKAPSIVGGAVLFADAKLAEAHINLYPSEFVDGVSYFDPDKSEFNEDFTEPGKWTEFTVSARSKGWVLDKLILETILKGLSLKKASARWDEPTPPTLEAAVQSLDSAIAKTVQGKARKLLYKQLLDGSDLFEICPNTWSNIDCVDEDYSDVTVSTGQLKIDEAAHTYEPEATGAATFRIETNEAFGAERTGMAHAVNTNEIVVHVDPFQAEADTVEWLEFHYWVDNATNTDVDIELFNGGTILIQDESTITIETPDAPWVWPLDLEVTSSAATGLRANAADTRSGSALISYQGVGPAYITPDFRCIKPGDPAEEFTVTYTAGTINSVEWSIDPSDVGSLSPSSTTCSYTPPSEAAGQLTLKATVNDSIDAYATIDVSDCRCYWQFSGGGSGQSYSATGTWAKASNLGGLTVTLTPEENVFRPLISFVVYEADEAGTFAAEGFYFEGVDEIGWAWRDTTVAKPTVTIDVFQYFDNGSYVAADYVQGSASGTLSRLKNFNPPEYEYITFTLENFRAEFFRLERPQCTEDTTSSGGN